MIYTNIILIYGYPYIYYRYSIWGLRHTKKTQAANIPTIPKIPGAGPEVHPTFISPNASEDILYAIGCQRHDLREHHLNGISGPIWSNMTISIC